MNRHVLGAAAILVIALLSGLLIGGVVASRALSAEQVGEVQEIAPIVVPAPPPGAVPGPDVSDPVPPPGSEVPAPPPAPQPAAPQPATPQPATPQPVTPQPPSVVDNDDDNDDDDDDEFGDDD